jgi:hypothetical protein
MGREDSASLKRSQRRTAAGIAWEGALAGLGNTGATARLLARSDASVPWVDVVAEAKRTRLAPLLYLGLRSAPVLRAMIPPTVAVALRQATHATAARVTHLERACADVVTAAATAGIRVLVLKGLALGALVYPTPVARPMDDVDLLVAETDREKITTILHDLGYRNDLMGEEDFCPPSRAYSIDLQTGLLNTTRVPARRALWPVRFDDLWLRRQTFVLAGVPVPTLGPRDTLMHLAVHAVHHHGLSGMQWMADFVASLGAWPLVPNDLLGTPPAVRRSLWYCLEVLAVRGHDPIPEVRAAVRPHRRFPMENRTLEAIIQGHTPEAIRYALTLACLPSCRDRASFLRQLLVPSSDVWKGFERTAERSPGLGTHWHTILRLGGIALHALVGHESSATKGTPP